jgi:aminoglycoside phosphotransferase (APT) family kinase protein
VRLPVVAWATGQAELERRWLPVLGPHLPLAVPTHRATGRPDHGYPFDWSVWDWLPGRSVDGRLDDAAADALAGFREALHAVLTDLAPPRRPHSRGGSLAERDEEVRRAIRTIGDLVDGPRTLAQWAEAVAAPRWAADVWLHGDLLPGNVLVHEGRVSAVIDWGSLTTGDPAADLVAAWHLFDGPQRRRFLGSADDATVARARGWVISQAVIALPYHRDTNPGIVAQSLRALAAVLR